MPGEFRGALGMTPEDRQAGKELLDDAAELESNQHHPRRPLFDKNMNNDGDQPKPEHEPLDDSL